MAQEDLSRRRFLEIGGLTLGAAAFGGLAGCTSTAKPSGATSGTPNTTGAVAPSTSTQLNGSTKTLSQLNASNGLKPTLLKLNAEYAKQTGISINVATDGNTYNQTLHARAQSGKMPDLYYPTATGLRADFAPYVSAGWALDLTPEMDAGWRSSFNPQLLEFCTYPDGNIFGVKPGIYDVPFDANCWLFYALPSVWKVADLDPDNPPADFAGLLTAMKELKKHTDTAFMMALAATNFTTNFIQTYASAVMSVDEIVATCQGTAPWSTPEWSTVIDLFTQIRDAKILAPGSINAGINDEEAAFFARKALGCFFGFAIDVPVGQVLAPGFTDFKLFMPPPLTAGKPMKIAGAQGKVMAVNAKSPNRDAAVAYLKWFTAPEQQAIYAKDVPAVPANPAVSTADLDPRVVPFAEHFKDALPPTVAFQAPVADALNRGIQTLMNGQGTAKSVLAAADKAQTKT